jgi:hypothetical protein
MNHTITNHWRRSVAGVLLAIAILTLGLTRNTSAQSEKPMTKQELKSLIANAKTREDHQKLASYYSGEANRFAAEAKEHEAMAEAYHRNPPMLASKHPMAIGEDHCRYVAERLTEASAKMQDLASKHEEAAKSVPQ